MQLCNFFLLCRFHALALPPPGGTLLCRQHYRSPEAAAQTKIPTRIIVAFRWPAAVSRSIRCTFYSSGHFPPPLARLFHSYGRSLIHTGPSAWWCRRQGRSSRFNGFLWGGMSVPTAKFAQWRAPREADLTPFLPRGRNQTVKRIWEKRA